MSIPVIRMRYLHVMTIFGVDLSEREEKVRVPSLVKVEVRLVVRKRNLVKLDGFVTLVLVGAGWIVQQEKRRVLRSVYLILICITPPRTQTCLCDTTVRL